MAFVYILESIRDGRYYIGSTENLEKRIQHHKNGGTPSTKRFGGVQLAFSQEYNSLAEARKVERRLKRLKRRDYVKKIISDGFVKLS